MTHHDKVLAIMLLASEYLFLKSVGYGDWSKEAMEIADEQQKIYPFSAYITIRPAVNNWMNQSDGHWDDFTDDERSMWFLLLVRETIRNN